MVVDVCTANARQICALLLAAVGRQQVAGQAAPRRPAPAETTAPAPIASCGLPAPALSAAPAPRSSPARNPLLMRHVATMGGPQRLDATRDALL